MKTNLVVLNNYLNGFYIANAENVLPDEQVTAYQEILILNEYYKAKFQKIDNEVEKAETQSFIFYRYNEDNQDNITWIDVKGAEPIIQ